LFSSDWSELPPLLLDNSSSGAAGEVFCTLWLLDSVTSYGSGDFDYPEIAADDNISLLF
jgi:hypothetical protein